MKIPMELEKMVPFLVDYDVELGPYIRWVNLAGLPVERASMMYSIYDYAMESNKNFAQTKLSKLFMADDANCLEPSGFIFHMSRCGSTLLTNMLRQSDRTIAWCEPEVLAKLLQMIEPENEDYVIELFKTAVRLLAERSTGTSPLM